MPAKKFIDNNGGIIAVVGAILACGWWITSNMASLQIEQQKQFKEQQKQFTEMIEKIGKIDADSRVRDKEIELMIAKK